MRVKGYTIGPKADLKLANLREADLKLADIRGADLRNADLRNADLRNADLRGAYLRGAALEGADLTEANLRGADLLEADLLEADLDGADLTGADLREAYLTRATLRGADLEGADITGADITGTNFTGANLAGVIVDASPPRCPTGIFELVSTSRSGQRWVRGYRSIRSLHSPIRTEYRPGTVVTAFPWLDTSSLSCQPGIYLCPTEEEALAWSDDIVDVLTLDYLIHQAGGKYRAEWVLVDGAKIQAKEE